MNRELQNMSEVSLQNLEEIVETELLTVEDIRERMDTTEKGKFVSPYRTANMCWSMIRV